MSGASTGSGTSGGVSHCATISAICPSDTWIDTAVSPACPDEATPCVRGPYQHHRQMCHHGQHQETAEFQRAYHCDTVTSWISANPACASRGISAASVAPGTSASARSISGGGGTVSEQPPSAQ